MTSLPLWRQREILFARLVESPFDPMLCEQFGLVLLEMGDRLDAGRFLLLAPDASRYREVIDQFLAEHKGEDWRTIVADLPNAAKRESFSSLPSGARQALRAAGYPAEFEQLTVRDAQRTPDPEGSGHARAPGTEQSASRGGWRWVLVAALNRFGRRRRARRAVSPEA